MEDSRYRQIVHTLAIVEAKGSSLMKRKVLLDRFGSAEAVLNTPKLEIIEALKSLKNRAKFADSLAEFTNFGQFEEEIEKTERCGAKYLLYTDEDYPPLLKELSDPPTLLYVNGDISSIGSFCISVVGTRSPSAYGKGIASWLAHELAKRSITVVSGFARGIDTEAHTAALEAGGKTIAVLGTGPDVNYPAENRKIRERIIQNGAIITEYKPGVPAHAKQFPARNRIISGISLGTVVVEAPVKSGALITAHFAAEHNREVFAIPGNITSSLSKGCHKLIREGAKPVSSIEDILEEFGDKSFARKLEDKRPEMSEYEIKIVEAIGNTGTNPEEIIQIIDIPAQTLSCLLLSLELKGIIRKMPGNIYTVIF